MTKKIRLLITLAASALIFSVSSCTSVPEEIPEMTSQELIQHGQSCFESANYKGALTYFNTAIERFNDWPNVYIEARYEIGHVYMKQKKYTQAEPIFNELLELYKNSTPGTYPAAYRKLAEIELAKIPHKTAK